MLYFQNIGAYFLMIAEMFRKPTKWTVMKDLILKEIEDLVIGSLGIVAFISFFVGGVVTIQTALNINSPLIPKYLVGFATRQSVILEFAPTFISVIMAGKVGSFITSSISRRSPESLPCPKKWWRSSTPMARRRLSPAPPPPAPLSLPVLDPCELLSKLMPLKSWGSIPSIIWYFPKQLPCFYIHL